MLPKHLKVKAIVLDRALLWAAMEAALSQRLPLWCHNDKTVIVSWNMHGLSGSPGTASVDPQSINLLLDFKVICWIFLWNNSIYVIGRNCRLGRVLGIFNKYSINARAFGSRTPYRAVGSAGIAMHAQVNNLWNGMICHSKASLLFQLMFVLDKRNTLRLRDRVRQTCLWKSMAGADLWSVQRPLTSLGMSAWPYRVTTNYSYFRNEKNNIISWHGELFWRKNDGIIQDCNILSVLKMIWCGKLKSRKTRKLASFLHSWYYDCCWFGIVVYTECSFCLHRQNSMYSALFCWHSLD